MIVRLLLLLMIAFIASSCSTTSVPHNQKPNAAVIVTGVGFNLESAKSDAIRAALALKTNQTLVSEQLLFNDEMLTDMLASSMSGQLSSFKVLDQTIDENGFYTILAEVGIRNRAKKQKKSLHTADTGNRVNGLEISHQISSAKALVEAKKLHKKSQLENAKKLSLSLLSGYIRAMQANLDEIKVDHANPEKVTLKLSYSLKNNWAKKQKDRAELIEAFWSNKMGSWMSDSVRYDEHIIRICEKKLFSTCTHLPTNPKQEIKNIIINIPVFSTSGEYLTCLKSEVESPLRKVSYSGYYRDNNYYFYEGVTSYWFDARTRRHSLNVRSTHLYSSNKKAEFFYPFIADLDSNTSCEIEGRKRHASAYPNNSQSISKELASNTLSHMNKLGINTSVDNYLKKNIKTSRKKYLVDVGSKIKRPVGP